MLTIVHVPTRSRPTVCLKEPKPPTHVDEKSKEEEEEEEERGRKIRSKIRFIEKNWYCSWCRFYNFA